MADAGDSKSLALWACGFESRPGHYRDRIHARSLCIPMVASRSRVERRLRAVSRDLQRLRTELAVVDEQLYPLVEEAEDARIRALVSETALAQKSKIEAERHADALKRHRDRVIRSLTELEALQDELLDSLTSR